MAWSTERVASLALGAIVVVLVVTLVAKSTRTAGDGKGKDAGASMMEAGGEAGPSATDPLVILRADASSMFLSDLKIDLPQAEAGALPDKAPRQVRFGVILVQYAGVQSAPPNARPRADATALADKLAGDAKTDFKAAVRQGDPGSAEDLGRIHRGILEPASEFALFSLGVGECSPPIETPRGYWIVKRLE